MPGRKLTLPVAECLLSLALPFLASAAPTALALNGKATVEDGRARYVRTAPGKGDSGFSLTWRFPEWTDDTYVFLPACAYNGNRDFSHFLKEYPSEIYYPPKFDASLVGKENARVVTNIPKLNEDGSGRIEVTSGDTATPCVGLFFPAARKGVLIFTSQQVGGMNVGYMVEKGCVIVSCPADRSDQYLFCRAHVSPHPDRPLTMAQGEEAEIRFLYLEFEAADIPSFYETFFRNRQRLLPGRRIPAPYTREVCAAVENGINRDSWMKEGFWAEGTTGRWTVGWVAGMPVAWGMLNAGSNLSRARARMVPDFLVAHQSETGAYREWWPNDRNRMGDDRISQPATIGLFAVRPPGFSICCVLRMSWSSNRRGKPVRAERRMPLSGPGANTRTGACSLTSATAHP